MSGKPFPDAHFRHRGKNAPREMVETWEVDRNARQKPTLFSSPNAKFRKSLRTEWMHSGNVGKETATKAHKAHYKARITLAKVWNEKA